MKKIKILKEQINSLESMKKIPDKLWYIGNKELLKRPRVSIVGSRRPLPYTKNLTYTLARELAKRGVVVVSGGAMGVDAIAHKGAGAKNTIAVMANGLDLHYPKINSSLIKEIEEEGLVLSQFAPSTKAFKWSFVVRNELVVALGEILIITEADSKSGSIRSAEYALKQNREIFVLPHRLNESSGTNRLLKEGLAEAIYDIDNFVDRFGSIKEDTKEDDFFIFCKSNPTLEEAIKRFKDRVYEEELLGSIIIEDGKIKLA